MKTNPMFSKEKSLILQFLCERTKDDPKGYSYLCDLAAAYRGWRMANQLGTSTLSNASFSRALPARYEHKLLMRGRYKANPGRAVLGIKLA